MTYVSESLWLQFGQYSYVVKLTGVVLSFDTCTPVAVGVTLIPRIYTPVVLETAGEINKCYLLILAQL